MANLKSQTVSVLLHGGFVFAFLSWQWGRVAPPVAVALKTSKLVFPAPLPKAPLPIAVSGSSGGANRNTELARRGVAPVRAARAFVPPQVVSDPKLALPVTLEVEVASVATGPVGDPFAKFAGNSLGSGGVGGIGNSGCCGRVGDGPGGSGAEGGAGHPIVPPKLLYKVEPEFSEEARKAKFQGTVVLSIEVDALGRPSHLQVVSSPGLGLDQKALEAVAHWRFRPAFRDGKPLAATARIEVSFHLL